MGGSGVELEMVPVCDGVATASVPLPSLKKGCCYQQFLALCLSALGSSDTSGGVSDLRSSGLREKNYWKVDSRSRKNPQVGACGFKRPSIHSEFWFRNTKFSEEVFFSLICRSIGFQTNRGFVAEGFCESFFQGSDLSVLRGDGLDGLGQHKG